MRYIIGIDLGTTNCAVSFVDTDKKHLPVELFSIPQFVAEGQMESRSTLPSFCYLSETGAAIVGQWAKVQGARVPTRLVQSAKSWLCNNAAERKERILPIEAADPSRRMSPVEASAHYLNHLKESWNRTMAKGDSSLIFEEQEIVITVPASFDEVARNLTVEAARLVGLSHVTLLEEPQAAFYSWIMQHEKTWETLFQEGQSILVCDVGGGTTDFSLIEIHSKDEKLTFQRMSVGDHLLLGGDNMDVALAHFLEAKLQHTVDGTQWLQLIAEARSAKEELLGPKGVENYTISLQGKGSSVVGGSLYTKMDKQEVEKVLGEGFFRLYSLQEALDLKKTRGLRSIGLPYEDEPSITKHLAHFLKQARYLEGPKGIDYILFNGGTLKPELFQQALVHSLQKWFPSHSTTVLASASLDLSVARGAAYYGKVRRGLGVAIGGGLPRTYYLEVDVKETTGEQVKKALTLLPRGSEEGFEFEPDSIFTLRANTPVSFQLLTSHIRLNDCSGEIIPIEDIEMQRLPPVQTVLRFGKKQTEMEDSPAIPVRIGIHLTAVGTVELWVASQKTTHRWNLEFQWRSASGQDYNLLSDKRSKQDETFASGSLDEAKKCLPALYAGQIKPSKIMDCLSEMLHQDRKEWSTSVLRELWTPLLSGASMRKSSVELEARFWNLAGFFLRPGYGHPLDDFRIKELWKIILADLKAQITQEIQIAQWICFRRIAGGLNKGQQNQIASQLVQQLFDKKTGGLDQKKRGDRYTYSEKMRTLASLERIDMPLKVKIGQLLCAKIQRGEGESYDYWCLARIGARHQVYGSIGTVVSQAICTKWVEALLIMTPNNREDHLYLLAQLARKTDQRELNLSDSMLTQIMDKYPELQEKLAEERILSAHEQEQIFGDQLPPGLILELNL